MRQRNASIFRKLVNVINEKDKLESDQPRIIMNQGEVPVLYKFCSLVTLVLISTTTVLVIRYSRTVPIEGPRYLNSSVVTMAELVKMITALLVVFINCKASVHATACLLRKEMIAKYTEMIKMAVPAVLYVIQNNLLFVALSNLDAATYQVTYQCKIFTTAVLTVIMFRKRLGCLKWLSLFVLMLGVVIVQLPSGVVSSSTKASTWSSQAVGMSAIFIACLTSGFSGVYLELILKTTSTSIWIRNFQLALFSIVPGIVTIFFDDWAAIRENGIFQGYQRLTWLVIFLQAYGGFVVAFVVKYTDNILKVFATSLSIVLSCVLSFLLLHDFQPTLSFLFGSTLVIASTFLYGYKKRAKPVSL